MLFSSSVFLLLKTLCVCKIFIVNNVNTNSQSIVVMLIIRRLLLIEFFACAHICCNAALPESSNSAPSFKLQTMSNKFLFCFFHVFNRRIFTFLFKNLCFNNYDF